jgi:hypothetical protein
MRATLSQPRIIQHRCGRYDDHQRRPPSAGAHRRHRPRWSARNPEGGIEAVIESFSIPDFDVFQ